MTAPTLLSAPSSPLPAFAPVEREALRLLRRLQEPGAFAIVSRGLGTGAVFVDRGPADISRVAGVTPAILCALLLRGWVAPVRRTPRLARYEITPAGRQALRSLVAEVMRDRRAAVAAADAPEAP